MANDKMIAQMSGTDGFIAALDQSGGSTPGALRLYGIPDSAYSGDAEMFRLVHQMRVRIMTAPAFTGAKVIAAILFEGTMAGRHWPGCCGASRSSGTRPTNGLRNTASIRYSGQPVRCATANGST